MALTSGMGLPSGHGADGIFLYGDIFCVAQARVDILASVALVGMDGHDIVAVRFQRGKRFRGDGLRHIARGPSFDFVCFDTVKVDFAVVVLVEPELQGVDLCLRKVADGEVAAYVNIGCVPRAPYESVGGPPAPKPACPLSHRLSSNDGAYQSPDGVTVV